MNNVMIENLKNIGVKFAQLDREETEPELWKAIFENNLYEVNKSMLEQYFSKNDFWNKSYTYISSIPQVKKYIDENINTYIRIILKCAQESEKRFFCDDESVAVEILNNRRIDSKSKEKYIANMSEPLADLNAVNDTKLWDMLLEYNSVIPSEDTIVKYFNNNTDNIALKNNILISFMNEIDDLSNLNFDNTMWKKYPDIKVSFYKLILSSTRLTKPADSIIKCAGKIKFDLQEMPNKIKSSYVKILIEKNMLLVTDKNVQEIIDSYFEHINILIHENINEVCGYLKNRSINLDQTDKLTQILKAANTEIQLSEKIKIIQAYPDRIKYSTIYGVDVRIEILKNHYVLDELYKYFKMYDEENPENKIRIYNELKRAENIRDFEKTLKDEHINLYNKLVNDGIL